MSLEKFALVGAASVGKTTVFEAFRKRYAGRADVAFVPEAGTIYFHEHPPASAQEVFSFETQAHLQQLTIDNEKSVMDLGPRYIIGDRSALDSVVHLLAKGDKAGADELLARVAEWKRTYTCLFYLEAKGVPFRLNDVRTEDAQRRNAIDAAFGQFFIQQDIPYMRVAGSEQKRIHAVEAEMGIPA